MHAYIQPLRNTGFFPRNIIQHSSGKLRKFIQKILAPNEMKNANAFTATETKVLNKIKSFWLFYYILF
jgi:hypothetical protein